MKNSKVILASIASLAVSTTVANAAITVTDVIAIDFGDLVTSTANYNHSTHTGGATDVADLVRLSDGAATGVSLTVTGSTQVNLSNIAGNGGNTTDSDIFSDGIIANFNAGAGSGNGPTALVLTFTNLDDSLTYDLVGGLTRATSQANQQNWATDWTAGGTTTNTSGIDPNGYVSFSGLTSTGGSLTITIDGTGTLSPLAQLELTAVAVPEPSSTALLGLGGLALILRRRK